MAVLVTKTMGELNEGRKSVYPLFEKPPKSRTSKPNKDEILNLPMDSNPNSASDAPQMKSSDAASKRMKKLGESSKPSAMLDLNEYAVEASKVDPNDIRRKRRKTGSPEATASPDHSREDMGTIIPVPQMAVRQSNALRPDLRCLSAGVDEERANAVDKKIAATSTNGDVNLGQEVRKTWETAVDHNDVFNDINNSKLKSGVIMEIAIEDSPLRLRESLPEIAETSTDPGQSKPMKVLHLNPKTGTIGSPPAKKITPQISGTVSIKASKTRGKHFKSRIVTIRYGHGQLLPSEIGLKIHQILNSTKIVDSLPKKTAPQPAKSSKSANNPKTTHPFFLGKASVTPSTPDMMAETHLKDVNIPQQLESTVTRAMPQSPENPLFSRKPIPSALPEFGSKAKMQKFPGAIEPAWPWQGMIHVRGDDQHGRDEPLLAERTLDLPSRIKKSKYQATQILDHEDVLGALASELNINEIMKSVKEINVDNFVPPPPCLRIPVKCFETGFDVQRRVRKELHTRLWVSAVDEEQSSSEDELLGNALTKSRTHPALTKAYDSISNSLSAFDQSQCETRLWIHKYSPKSTKEVLQTGREVSILKEWLQTLTVKLVETGSADKSASRASSVSRGSGLSKSDTTGKRKRKAKKLEGFVVSSDDEEDDMDEISEPEDDSSPLGSQSLLKKTVIRAGDVAAKGSKESTRFMNAIVMSGPHGCGKTAAVYAVAEELGFEVFELNPSSRRAGKDILEKVGDMTRNHLVQRSRNQAETDTLDDDAKRISEALAKDINSGRQGTMKSFFKPKGSTNSKVKATKATLATKKLEGNQSNSFPKAPPNEQKQSLILLEEVDVIYEEDKQFWATVMTMIAQSKRPIIMTCNDESVVPLHSLSLHAIIRLSPPPINLAVDYMILVASNEGHVFRREAVKALYESRQLDLRASLTELNFWCQFAVGDCKGGLDWFYPRWPPGCDVDENGHTVRVVSEGTYDTGMGWLCRDFLDGHSKKLDVEEEMLRETWDGWQLDLGNWQKALELPSWANKIRVLSKGREDDRAALCMYENFADAMSASDLCSGGAFALDYETRLDASIPELPVKVREDYVIGYELLEAPSLSGFDSMGKEISLWLESRARAQLQMDTHIPHGFEVQTNLDTPTETQILNIIRDHSSRVSPYLSRRDFSLAFDPISEPEKSYLHSTGSLEASSFDRTTNLIAVDIAPYVRSIVSYDARLQQDRARLSNLLSERGRRGKRMRTTRAAISALEGGTRSTTRRDRYFGPHLNPNLVLQTGLQCWLDAAMEEIQTGGGSKRSDTEDSEPAKMDSDS